MTTRTRITAGIATGLIAAALVPAAAVGYSDFGTGTPSAGGGSNDAIFTPKGPRDTDAAVPFVANVSSEAPRQAAATGDGGFDTADAVIGAGAALAIVAVIVAASGTGLTRRRNYSGGTPPSAARHGV